MFLTRINLKLVRNIEKKFRLDGDIPRLRSGQSPTAMTYWNKSGVTKKPLKSRHWHLGLRVPDTLRITLKRARRQCAQIQTYRLWHVHWNVSS